MAPGTLIGAIAIAAGVAIIARQRRLASNASRRIWFWTGRKADEDDYAFQYEVLGGIFITVGVVIAVLSLLR